MATTIYTANPSALIPQPGRAVNTFPSGLVRVDQSYLGLTTEAATHRAILAVGNDMPDGDATPSIDGLKIFPEVQERRREDGFTEYLVSAYGRVKTTATIERGVKNRSVGAYSLWRNTATAKIVSHTLPTLESLNFPPDAFDPISAYYFADIDGDFEAETITKISSGRIITKWRFDFGSSSRDFWFMNPGITVRRNPERYISLPLTLSHLNFGYWTEWVFAYG